MNTCTNSRSGMKRVLSWVLAFALVFSLTAVSAATASADEGVYSAEALFSAEGADISGKLTLDVNNLLLGLTAGMYSQGQSIMDASAYLSPFALAVDSMLIGGAYGIDLTTVAQNLPKSIFAPTSGSAYALDQESYDQIMALLSGELTLDVQVSADAPAPSLDETAMAEAAAVLIEAYSGSIEELIGLLNMETSSGSVVVNGKPVQVDQIRFTADADSCVAITSALIAPLEGNVQAQEALATIIDQSVSFSGQDLGATGAEIVQMLTTQLPQQLETARAELAEAGFSVSSVVCLASDTQMPVKIGFELKADGDDVEVNLLISETLDFFRLEVLNNGQAEGAFEFAITENSENALSFKFSVQEEDAEAASVDFRLNKAGRAFVLSISSNGAATSVSGYYNITDTLFSLAVDKLNGQEFGGTITLNLRSDDSIRLPSFTELTTLSEADFTALVQTISQTAESLGQMFG